jgi:hypothetical protein
MIMVLSDAQRYIAKEYQNEIYREVTVPEGNKKIRKSVKPDEVTSKALHV